MNDGEARAFAPKHAIAKGRRSEQRIAIHATPRTIWATLGRFEHWSDWSGLYVRSAGVLALGAPLDMAIALDGMRPLPVRAVVISLQPPHLIEYETRLLGGLLRAVRYIEVHATGPSASMLVNGEILGGPLAFLSPRSMERRVLKGIASMNEALKAIAEAEG